MGQQIADRHRPLRRPGFVRAIVIDARQHDLAARELGKVFRHRIVDADLALLDEHHHRQRGDRLGHRRDPEDRVGRHRHGFRVELPGCVEKQLAVAVDDHHRYRRHIAACDALAKKRREHGASALRQRRRGGLKRENENRGDGERSAHADSVLQIAGVTRNLQQV